MNVFIVSIDEHHIEFSETEERYTADVMDELEPQQYQGGDANDLNAEQPIAQAPHIQQKPVWQPVRIFQDEDAARAFIENEKCWSRKKTDHLAKGIKVTYRCNGVKKRGKAQCEKAIYTLQTPMDVTLFVKGEDHTCENSPDRVTRIPDHVQEIIIDEYKNGRTLVSIMFALRDKGIMDYNKSQVGNVCAYYRKKTFSQLAASIAELEAFISKHKNLPVNEELGMKTNGYAYFTAQNVCYAMHCFQTHFTLMAHTSLLCKVSRSFRLVFQIKQNIFTCADLLFVLRKHQKISSLYSTRFNTVLYRLQMKNPSHIFWSLIWHMQSRMDSMHRLEVNSRHELIAMRI